MSALDFPSQIGWLFLDLNSYFASVEQQCNPELRNKPIAVVPLETDSTCAIAASYEAKAFGIKTGTPIYEAKRKCPELICILANHEHYVDFHHQIIEEIEHHIPVTEVASIDEVACELDKTERTPQEAIKLAKRIKHGIHQNVGEAIHCSIGIAPNRFLAKIGTELQKPNGLSVIEPHEIPYKILQLSFEDIPGIGYNMQQRLHRNGVYSLTDLYQLSPKHMRAIWHSVAGERLWYQLRGVEIEPKATQRRTVGHSHVLSPENRPVERAKMVGKRMLLKAASRLRRLGYQAKSMTVSIRLENRKRIAADINFESMSDSQKLSRQWLVGWNKLTQQPDFTCINTHNRIKKIAITLHHLQDATQAPDDLFTYTQNHDKELRNNKLSDAMDELNTKYGRNTVTTADTLGDANVVTGTKIAFSRIPDKAEFYE